jgi:RNA polymerase sigma-70 factor, ECF subfamily
MRQIPADEAKLAEIASAHRSSLLNYLAALNGGDRHKAEDLFQEVMIRLWNHPDVVASGSGAVRNWLFAVARNVAIDAWRSSRRRVEVPANLLEHVAGPDENEAVLTAYEIRQLLGRLRPAHRSVIAEIYLRSRSVSEAAQQLDIPPGTVKSRAHHALRALRAACAERGLDAAA